jgi:hypothetical protein
MEAKGEWKTGIPKELSAVVPHAGTETGAFWFPIVRQRRSRGKEVRVVI